MKILLKPLLPAWLILVSLGFTLSPKMIPETYPLDGTWKPTREELGGNEMPATYYQSHVLVIKDTTYLFTAESEDRGVIRYENGKMDITGKEGINSGRSFKAIYELKNDSLKICYNLKGDTYPSSFDTKGNPFYFLVDLVRSSK